MRLGRSRPERAVGAAAAIATLIGSSSAVAVHQSMHLTATMEATDFSKVPLIPIDLTVGIQEGSPVMAKDVIMNHMGHSGAIVFAVRRPG